MNEDLIAAQIAYAFDFWRYEFEEPTMRQLNTFITVGTQKFVRTACAADTQIKFQFGFLTPEQSAVITDAKRFVSLAVRTDYDRQNLRGKGFVYIAPDSGPSRPQIDGVSGSFWRGELGVEQRLYKVLTHEIGHVFGIPHSGVSSNDVMGAAFPVNALKVAPGSVFGRYFRFFNFGGVFSNQLQDIQRMFFGISTQVNKVFGITQLSGNIDLRSFDIGSAEQIGSIVRKSEPSASTLGESVGFFSVPEEQKVFPKPDQNLLNLFWRPLSRQWIGEFQPVSNSPTRRVIVSQTRDYDMQAIGIMDDQIVLDIIRL